MDCVEKLVQTKQEYRSLSKRHDELRVEHDQLNARAADLRAREHRVATKELNLTAMANNLEFNRRLHQIKVLKLQQWLALQVTMLHNRSKELDGRVALQTNLLQNTAKELEGWEAPKAPQKNRSTQTYLPVSGCAHMCCFFHPTITLYVLGKIACKKYVKITIYTIQNTIYTI